MDKINSLAIIEDDAKVRGYLTDEVERHFDISVRQFADGESALKELIEAPTDIALFDIHLPGIDGIECIRRLKAAHPRMQLMVLTVFDNATTVFDALRAGAVSYLLKTTPSEKIVEAILEVANGGSPISSQIARRVIESFFVKERTNHHYVELSRREQEILEFLSKGYRYKEIAEKLFISIETVRTHIRNTYEKLQVNSRIEALRKTGLM